MSIALIVPAAGSGSRLGANVPKALVEVAGRPLLHHALSRFAQVVGLTRVVVAAPASATALVIEALARTPPLLHSVEVVAGGATRQDSVRAGLDVLDASIEWVCVHDAARPLTSLATVHAVIAAARRSGAATAASRPHDSVREDAGEGVTRPVDRSRLWLVETPQAFAHDVIRRAHDRARGEGAFATDDATLVEAYAGGRVAIVESEGLNLKVTRPDDLMIVRRLMET